jgi:hypothetical protein
MKHEKFCSQLNTYFKKKNKGFIQEWLQLDEGDPGFQLLTKEEIAAVIFFIYFHQHFLYY